MIQISLIICFMVVYLHDSLAPSLGLTAPASPWISAAGSLGPFAALMLFTHVAIARQGRVVDRTGSWAAVRAAEAIVRRSRVLAVGLHLINVGMLGWVDAVRALTGDVILVDELIILSPVLLAWTLGWWSVEPIERKVREATLVRDLDSGKPLYPIVTRWQFVLSNIRYHVLLIFVPMCILLAWAETVERYGPRLLGKVLGGPSPAAQGVLQLAGVGVLFVLMPVGLRLVWDTVPLGDGPMREMLVSLCRRARVRVGNLLVWRTHGLMLNGAVVGLFWPLRYILLTDALLDALSPRQVEAVAAHEVGHVRRRHLIWLALTMLTTITGASLLLSVVLMGVALVMPDVAGSPLAEAGMALASLLASLVVMGYVSRRFEWQADAFAVAAISRMVTEDGVVRTSPRVTAEAVEAMHTALTTVAQASGLPLRKFTWRHGSIYTRQQRLAALVSRPVERLPIDRDVRWLKVTIGVATGAVAAVMLGIAGLGALASMAQAGP